MIKANAYKYSVSAICCVLQVNRSTYYYEAKQSAQTEKTELNYKIIEIFKRSRHNYGSRKIKKELEHQGKQVLIIHRDYEKGPVDKRKKIYLPYGIINISSMGGIFIMMGRTDSQMHPIILDMDSMIPQNHLLRQIKNCVNFDFIYEKVAPYYSHTSRKSIEQMLLIGYLYGINVVIYYSCNSSD